MLNIQKSLYHQHTQEIIGRQSQKFSESTAEMRFFQVFFSKMNNDLEIILIISGDIGLMSQQKQWGMGMPIEAGNI